MLASTVRQVDFEDVRGVEFERLVSAAPAFETLPANSPSPEGFP